MSLYPLPTLIGALWSLALALIVLTRSGQARVNKVFSFLCFAIFTWLSAYTVAYFTKDINIAAISCRIACTAVILVNPLFYDFAVSYLRIDRERKFVVLAYVVTALMVPLFLFTNVFLDIPHKYYWGYYSKAGPYHPLYLVIFFVIFLRSIYLWFKAFLSRKTLPPIEKNRLKYLFAVSILIMLAGSDYLQKYGIEVYPFGWIFVVLYSTVAFMAILRYHLLDIEVIIKKTLVFASLFASVFTIAGVVTLLLQNLLGKFIPINNWISIGINIALLIFLYDPLRNFLVNTTNRYLFQKRYDPVSVIMTLSKAVLTELDINKIARLTVEKLVDALNLKSCALLIPNKEGNKFLIKEERGIADSKIFFEHNAPLVAYLNKVNGAALKNGEKPLSGAIIEDMKAVDADVCLAIMVHKQLIGILAVGGKKSDENYTKEDINTLMLLADALGISITNALNFEDVRQKEKLATIGTLAGGIKHEIGTPLNKISSAVQKFLIAREDGDHKKMQADEVVSEAYDLLTRCQMTFEKVSAISAKFADFAKPRRKADLELVNISDSIEDALGVLEHEIQAKNISVKKEIQADLPRVAADRDYMQQIFFNIIRNGAQAIQEARKSKEDSLISIVVKEEPKTRIHIEISDTGVGIAQDNLSRIFEPYYTTKPEGRGSGLGLAIVKELVERNNGTILVRSELGKGTSFILEFLGASS